jgi:hypothetical protein
VSWDLAFNPAQLCIRCGGLYKIRRNCFGAADYPSRLAREEEEEAAAQQEDAVFDEPPSFLARTNY